MPDSTAKALAFYEFRERERQREQDQNEERHRRETKKWWIKIVVTAAIAGGGWMVALADAYLAFIK